MEDHGQFSVLDYSFFVVVFVLSAGIGLYYAIKSRNKDVTIEEYLLGGRNMSLLPVSCSVIATSISASTIVGLASEAYAYGTYSWLFSYGVFFMAIVSSTVFLPVFHELKLTSSFKYFEMRFNRNVRLLASGLFILTGLIYLSVTIYIPALTFQQVTGINIYVTVVILSVLCACYTAVGGFKAVVWTDVVQLFLILSSVVIIIVIGIRSVGGFDKVYNAADRGGRIYFFKTDNMNSRTSFLSTFLSTSFVCNYQFGLNQANLQRFLSLSNLKKTRLSVLFLAITFISLIILSQVLGAIIYANYETCDPVKAGTIKRFDQVLPFFIQEKASLFLGFNGIFVAGMFSASLSTTSSYLNAMSGIIYEDFISHRYPDISDKVANKIMKSTVLILGIVQIASVFLVERMGMIGQITMQCMALNTSAIITLFILGVLVPKANSKGAMAGAFAAIGSLLILIIGSINYKPEPTLPFRIDGCENPPTENYSNSTLSALDFTDTSDTHWPFKLNFTYYGFTGPTVGLIVGCLTSWLTGGHRVTNEKLLAPFLRHKCRPEEEIRLQDT